jgi:hypothetical protein
LEIGENAVDGLQVIRPVFLNEDQKSDLVKGRSNWDGLIYQRATKVSRIFRLFTRSVRF